MRLKKYTVRALMVLSFALTISFPAYATKKDVQGAKDKVTSLEQEKKKVEQTIKDLESLKSDAAAYVKELDNNLLALDEELGQLEQQIGAKETEIEENKKALEAAKETEDDQYESMKLRIQYMYEKGETSYIEMLLEAESFGEMLNRAEYISKISEYDRKMLDNYIAVKEDIAAKEASLEKEHQELVELQDSTEAKKASAEALISQKQKELQNFESQISTAEGQLSDYEKDIKAQEDKIKQLEAEMKRKEEEAKKKAESEGKQYNTVSLGNINFIWPCPSSSRITSAFGGRSSPTEGASTNHQGIDIGASMGSDIVAAADGEVTISTYSYSAGNYIMINHGGGVSTVYMHCSKLLVSVGEQVKQGQVIAKVGSTGYSTGPHLHFGIRSGGSYVNPQKYVSP